MFITLPPSKPMLCYDFSYGGHHLTLVKADGRTEDEARAYAIHVACDLNIWGGDHADTAPYERRMMLQRADVKLITLGLPTTV